MPDPISEGRMAALQGQAPGNPSPDDTMEQAGGDAGEQDLSEIVDILRQHAETCGNEQESAAFTQAADLIEPFDGDSEGAPPAPEEDVQEEAAPPTEGTGETG